MRNCLKCQSQAYYWFFYILIPTTLYKIIMSHFDKLIHVYDWNLSILWLPLKTWMPQSFIIANFGYPVSKSWLRPWSLPKIIFCYDASNIGILWWNQGNQVASFENNKWYKSEVNGLFFRRNCVNHLWNTPDKMTNGKGGGHICYQTCHRR